MTFTIVQEDSIQLAVLCGKAIYRMPKAENKDLESALFEWFFLESPASV